MAAAAEMDSKYDKVDLIPWDPRDEKQYQRMYDQRVACGWREDEVGEWKEKMLRGTKFLYWVAVKDSFEDKAKFDGLHVAKYPKESEPLVDTMDTVQGQPREPTGKTFLPVGHIALELIPKRDEKYSLPPSSLWIMSLYISWAIQQSGLGRAAMYKTEAIGRSPPLNARVIALDTVSSAFTLREENVALQYDARGMQRPKEVRGTEIWYGRQGYEAIDLVEGDYMWTHPVTKEVFPLPVVYMKKVIA